MYIVDIRCLKPLNRKFTLARLRIIMQSKVGHLHLRDHFDTVQPLFVRRPSIRAVSLTLHS